MLKIVGNGLSPVKDTGITNRCRQCIGLGENVFAPFKIFKSESVDVGGEMIELTKASVSVSVESSNKGSVVEIVCQASQRTPAERGSEPAADIVATTQVLPECIQ